MSTGAVTQASVKKSKTSDSDLGGPASLFLEADLREWVRRHGILVWLDIDGHYTAFVGRLKQARAAGNLPYEVYSFSGSHLRLLLDLEHAAGGAQAVPLVLHLPGFNEETVHASPFLELYAAGTRYRKALDTLVTEAAARRVRPELIESFKNEGNLSLAGADAWLRARTAEAAGGLAAELARIQSLGFFDDLLRGGSISSGIATAEGEAPLWDRVAAWFGLSDAWKGAVLTPPPKPGLGKVSTRERAENIAFAVAGWCLCVEYVDDLRRPPVSELLLPAESLPKAVIQECRDVAVHLRDAHPVFYRRVADEVEALLLDEVEKAKAEDLGRVDTFRFEEMKILEGALVALATANWDQAMTWAAQRVDTLDSATPYWLRDDALRRQAWQLVHVAARLGQAVVSAGDSLFSPKDERSLESAAQRYSAVGAAVDHAHRHLEQRRLALLVPQLPEFERLRSQLDAAREVWRNWADDWALEFSAVCKKEGFLPPASLQQRTIFDEVVRPLTQETGTTAYFVIDAFRYEMGAELFARIDGTPATTCLLRPRMAELPSVTEIGMNVLAPVAREGRLFPKLSESGDRVLGFQATAEFNVNNPEKRRRAMHDRVGGDTCPWLKLEEVLSRDTSSLKRTVAKARLLVVHSEEIDKAGEKGVGPAVFDVVMQHLRSAWRLLRDAGVRRFVFTSDHGFLLLEGAARSSQAHGRKIDPHGRHVFSSIAADHTGEIRVALSDLGYEGAPGHVMFPETTAVFDRGGKTKNFAHGGNSLQERIIPVLTVVHRAAAGGNAGSFVIEVHASEGVAGMHCLEMSLQASQTGLNFGGPKELELGLNADGVADVQVELCQTRGKARLDGGLILATVGERFEVFFRLTGLAEGRVQVAVNHPSNQAKVDCVVPPAWFEVAAAHVPKPLPAAGIEGKSSSAPYTPDEAPESERLAVGVAWLNTLPAGGVRDVFAHLMSHGTATEAEVSSMLGGARAARRFTNDLDGYVKKTPFQVRIEVVAGVKRFKKEEM